MKRILILAGCAVFGLLACELEQDVTVFSISYDFSQTDNGWTGDFADYPAGDSLNFELFYKHDTLPTNLNLNATKKALHLAGRNGSDDLFMFVKKRVTGLKPNTTYAILFNVRFASNAPTGEVGIGGAPGESVFLKAGASLVEPKKVLQEDAYVMNIDKGNQAQAGVDAIVLGNIGVAATTSQFTYTTRNNTSNTGFNATTDANGQLWLLVGTDSGFEGTTRIYYSQIDVLFNQVND
jgi:hypothetical protein